MGGLRNLGFSALSCNASYWKYSPSVSSYLIDFINLLTDLICILVFNLCFTSLRLSAKKVSKVRDGMYSSCEYDDNIKISLEDHKLSLIRLLNCSILTKMMLLRRFK